MALLSVWAMSHEAMYVQATMVPGNLKEEKSFTCFSYLAAFYDGDYSELFNHNVLCGAFSVVASKLPQIGACVTWGLVGGDEG